MYINASKKFKVRCEEMDHGRGIATISHKEEKHKEAAVRLEQPVIPYGN